MPRNASGVYSLPAGSTAVDGLTADASVHNIPLTDLTTDANTARPIVAGGTGATTAATARANLDVAGRGSNETIAGDWVFTGTATFSGAISLPVGAVETDAIADDAITIGKIEDAALSGSDATLITGTAGTADYLAQWNSDGDLVNGPQILDQDDMSANSATALATQQSIKAYVDARVPFGKVIAFGLLNGTGTPAWALRGGFGATVTDNGAGDYTVAFDSAEPDTNYCVFLTVQGPSGVVGRYYAHWDSLTTSGFDIHINNATGTATDIDGISVMVVRAV